jgi:uncharacterized protein (DUF1778 family)
MTETPAIKPRKSRSGSENRKCRSSIGFRTSDEEYALIQAAADRVGLTVSSYARSRALAKPNTRAVRRPTVAVTQLAQLLGMLGNAGGGLQRIEARLQTDESPLQDEIAVAVTEFRMAAAAILQTLGKHP